MRLALPIVLTLIAAPLVAQEHDHLHEDGIRVLHAWTTAGDDSDMRLYIEIENNRGAPVVLTGAETEAGATGRVIGAAMKAEGDPTPLPGIEIAAGHGLTLSPNTIYVQIDDAAPRREGDEVEIHAETLSPDARAHPHAGHAH